MSGRLKTDDACGQLAGAKRHYYRKTELCEPCRQAWREYQARAYRIAQQRRARRQP